MLTDANTEAAVGRARIARHRVQGSAVSKIFVTQGRGKNIVEVPLSAVPARSIQPWSWRPSFPSNLRFQSQHIVAWSMVAVAIVVLAVTVVKNQVFYQTASAATKSTPVVADPNPQPAPRQLVVQKAINQPTNLAAIAPIVNTHAATQPPAPPRLPPQQPPPPSGQVPGFGGSTPFVQTKFFIVPPPGETRYVPNELVLQIGSHISRETVEAVAASLGLTILDIQNLRALGTTTIRVSTNNISIAEAVRLLARQQIIAAATVNYVYSLTQNLAARSSEEVEGDAGQYVLGKLHLSDVHREFKGTNISIGVIDSEIDGTHPDLEGVISGRFDATGSEEKPHPHGTGMAGAIASHRKLLGIAPGARLLAIRAFVNKASSVESTTFNILKSLDYAINNGVRIVNMSFAGPRDPTLERAFKVAHDKGVVLIAAAGNAGPKSPPLYPAADQSVIAVTATDIDDKVFSSANRGRHIAISAPGVDILVPAPEGTYQMTTGTSVATAHISGIVALLLERNPKLTPDDIREILTASAKRLGPNNEFGAGLVDPPKALKLAEPKTEALTSQAVMTRLGLAAAPGPAAR
jgi:Subtilase family